MPTITTPNLLTDPGYLFWAPLGSAIPANTAVASKFTDTWPVAWLPLGATSGGSTLTYTLTVQRIDVAELLDPVQWRTTDRSGTMAFALAQWSLTNLKYALNGGTITTTGTAGTTVNTYALPVPGQEVRSMIGWESTDATVRLVILQAISSGSVASAFQKAPAFAELPTSWNMEIPTGGSQPFNTYTAGTPRG